MFKFMKQVSSLEKVFTDSNGDYEKLSGLTVLKGEEISYQIAFAPSERLLSPAKIQVSVSSEIKKYITIYNVVSLPSDFPAYPDRFDEHYITREPGLFPELLMPLDNGSVTAVQGAATSLWVDVRLPRKIGAGKYDITVTLSESLTGMSESKTITVDVIDAVLPKNDMPVTMWFHNDCIADVHNVAVFSDEHWVLIEKYMKAANDIGINMILTPLFTPPLDTEVGGERPTVQLVDVSLKNGRYEFGFEKLDRYLTLAKKCGMMYFEMSHLFTQWGAEHAPKIVAKVGGKEKKLFGWETDVRQEEYPEFLAAFLPKLTEHLRKLGVAGKCFFHISDEPSDKMLENYKYAKSLVSEYLKGFTIIDALSHFSFYADGTVEHPVVATTDIKPFLETKADIFCYYCCGQVNGNVANRMFSMPSVRNRILAYQMFKYDIKGFLQWGFNFYYTHLSKRRINPFVTTDAGGIFPSGDAFVVYPTTDGKPYYSLRAKVFKEMLSDLSAMRLLESLSDKQSVVRLYDADGTNVDFNFCPDSSDFVLQARQKINVKIAEMNANKNRQRK